MQFCCLKPSVENVARVRPLRVEARCANADLMPTIASSELPVPKSWDEFEDICADLFGRIWNDHNIVRYGRMGQRQNGVDIRGHLPAGGIAGVQCKKKTSMAGRSN